LPEDYRRALVGRYVDGRSVKVLAESLGRTYKGTESLLSRARVKFQEIFLSDDGGQDDER
jgi:DNA-directed RNA polymerase specialized sigma24 family protein